MQDLRDDPDEMLRGVDWGKVARFVDLSDELQLFEGPSTSDGGGPGGSGPPCPGVEGEPPAAGPEHGDSAGQREARQAAAAAQQAAAAVLQHDELFNAAGWAAPATPRGSAKSRRAEALADMG